AVIYGLIYIRKDFYIGLIYILLGIISLFKHRSNINRLIHGKESKLGKN
ncbi:MAG: acyl-phosphate glycerol 3-phosphate acyltransferase, partial [Finegoldia magna]|nr:acyl-phosphate glycerol 3-phosphate acyltransferase [Finegoldia magna]